MAGQQVGDSAKPISCNQNARKRHKPRRFPALSARQCPGYPRSELDAADKFQPNPRRPPLGVLYRLRKTLIAAQF